MGRPKGSSNKKEETKKDEINIEELVAKAVADALAENEKRHKKEIKELEEKLKSGKSSDLKDISIEITNNTLGAFVVGSKRGAITTRVLRSYKDSTLLDYKDFRLYYSENRRFFKSGELLITDVVGDSTVDEVCENIKFKPIEQDYDELLSGDYENFKEFLDKNKDSIDNMLDHALELHKKGKFDFASKRDYFRRVTKNYDLFNK
jgi:hypothetical protein